jgi:hypothetical protein
MAEQDNGMKQARKLNLQKQDALAKKIKANIDLQLALDEMVIDCHSKMASHVNNEGAENQIEWLHEIYGLSLKEILDGVKE